MVSSEKLDFLYNLIIIILLSLCMQLNNLYEQFINKLGEIGCAKLPQSIVLPTVLSRKTHTFTEF